MRANVSELLLQHYVDKFRALAWRSPPGSPPADPYRVWLSEVMLQQTTVAAVEPRFRRFIERWPTVDDLARASESEVMGEWAGLGYYARARNLHDCARLVASAGGFPDNETELRKLPGVGDYTAAAIAAIAFGRRAVVVDSNVERVVARLFALKSPTKAEIRRLADRITPGERSGDFAQAMMDLGATICRPKAPDCGNCPVAGYCLAFASGTPEAFPRRKAKKARPVRHGIAYWIRNGESVWLVRRPRSGLLGGMAALPGTDWTEEMIDPHGPALARVRHVFTHFELRLTLVASNDAMGDGWWAPIDQLEASGLPTLYRRAAKAALAA